MHAHIDWTAQDCDGTLSGSHALTMTEEEQASDFGDLEFQGRVLSDVVNVGARHGTLTVEEDEDDGTPRLDWSESTEEGGRTVSAVFYADDACCLSDHATTRRDHTAEAAGY